MTNLDNAQRHQQHVEQALSGEDWKQDAIGAIAHALAALLDLAIQDVQDAPAPHIGRIPRAFDILLPDTEER